MAYHIGLGLGSTHCHFNRASVLRVSPFGSLPLPTYREDLRRRGREILRQGDFSHGAARTHTLRGHATGRSARPFLFFSFLFFSFKTCIFFYLFIRTPVCRPAGDRAPVSNYRLVHRLTGPDSSPQGPKFPSCPDSLLY